MAGMSSSSETASLSKPAATGKQCHTCRKRRVRCDSAEPACQKCRDKGIECLGYGKQKPLVWLEGGGNQNQYLKEASLPVRERKSRKKGRPRLIVASDDTSASSSTASTTASTTRSSASNVSASASTTSTSPSPRQVTPEEDDRVVKLDQAAGRVPETMMFSYPAEIQKVVRTIWYYEHELAPDLDPINHLSFVEAEDPTAWQDDLASILWHILICAVDTHKAIRTQPDDQVEISRSVYKSKSQTFMRLNKNLADPKTRISDVTLVGVLTLFLAETQLSAVGSWKTHFEGACHIIRLRGGVKTIARHSAPLNGLLTYFMVTDVLSFTTISASLPILDTRRQLEYVEIISDVYQNGSGTCFPCPNELFDAIIQINHLRALSENAIVEVGQEDGSTASFKAAVHALLEKILSFPIASWADQMDDRCSQQPASFTRSDPKKAYLRPTRDDWVHIASVYHAATAIYCVRSLALGLDELLHVSFMVDQPIPPSYVSTSDVLLVAKKILFDRLREILVTVTDPRKSFIKVLVWPMFVAGVEAAVDPEAGEIRTLLESVLRRLCRSLGTLSICGLRNFLMALWDHVGQIDGYEQHLWSWSELLMLSPGRSIFFM
ncbi:hypothetical protein MferCBS31731_006243 [Microsporum ferrugineum]